MFGGVWLSGVVWSLALAAVTIAGSVVAALAALLVMSVLEGRRETPGAIAAQRPGDDVVLVFDGDDLVEASDSGHLLIDGLAGTGPALGRFLAWAEPRFPGLVVALGRLVDEGEIGMESETGAPLKLRAEWCDGLARITLHDPAAAGREMAVDRLSHAAMLDELALSRRLLENAPLPIWREGRGGQVIWANPAYLQAVSARDADAGLLTWPLPALLPATPGSSPRSTGLRRIEAPDEGGHRLVYALNQTPVGPASATLDAFRDTLSKTFANLPVGLAVFDPDRQLVLFNPALVDLSTLDPGWLAGRPSFDAFFDALREAGRLPEPRNYREWREGLTRIERAVATGRFEETWTLSSGQTWRVTGRPHPDGASAFLIEDISAEISLSRRFRAELDTGQAVLDSLDTGIAVFCSASILVMCNTAYCRQWNAAPDAGLNVVTLRDSLGLWRKSSADGPQWQALAHAIETGVQPAGWAGRLPLRDGRALLCKARTIAGGATVFSFGPEAAGSGWIADATQDPGLQQPSLASGADGVAGVTPAASRALNGADGAPPPAQETHGAQAPAGSTSRPVF